MAKVSAYFFKAWSISTGETSVSKRLATLDAIKGKGEPILETERKIDSSDLDDGFYPKRGLWIVEVFDLVSRPEGKTRVSVPMGEYTMRELPGQVYSLTHGTLPFSFELTLTEVSTYLQGQMKIIAGKWL